MDLPIWVIVAAVGILFSAVMTVKTGKVERQLEMESIEREGEIYMNRLQKEREQRDKMKKAVEGQ